MLLPLEKAIVKTLVYADIFDYPLTSKEIWQRLINFKCQISDIKSAIPKLKIIEEKEGYYFLRGKRKLLEIRKKRERYSQRKLEIAQKIINFIKIIPSVKLIGITGTLAIDNAKKDDDIDVIIITAKNLLWTTRFLTILLTEFTGRRRHPNEINVNDKICLNMFLDEAHLELPKGEQDLFCAYEILQMKPIFSKEDIYQRFLLANQWVKKYLPNIWEENFFSKEVKNHNISLETNQRFHSFKSRISLEKFFAIIEFSLRKFQLWYMRKRRTKEMIKDGFIRFHPEDARKWILTEYRKKLTYLGINLTP